MSNTKIIENRLRNPTIQVRKFFDGTYSVMARVWNPQKEFYEHPTLINLTEEDAEKYCLEVIKDNPTIEEIISKWVFIGN